MQKSDKYELSGITIECEFAEETTHGHKTVEIFADKCEVGEGCLEQCKYAFPEGDTETMDSMYAEVKRIYPCVDDK